jgi:hypothetical protein
MKIDLTDDEAAALRALLTEKTNLPTKFRHSPMQEAYRSVREKLDHAKGETPLPKARRVKSPPNESPETRLEPCVETMRDGLPELHIVILDSLSYILDSLEVEVGSAALALRGRDDKVREFAVERPRVHFNRVRDRTSSCAMVCRVRK